MQSNAVSLVELIGLKIENLNRISHNNQFQQNPLPPAVCLMKKTGPPKALTHPRA
jgi:hypothetical protein